MFIAPTTPGRAFSSPAGAAPVLVNENPVAPPGLAECVIPGSAFPLSSSGGEGQGEEAVIRIEQRQTVDGMTRIFLAVEGWRGVQEAP